MRELVRLGLLVAIGATGLEARAAPLEVTNGKSVNLAIAGRRVPAISLDATRTGWKAALRVSPRFVRVSDVTSGAPVGRWILPVTAGQIVLGRDTFLPGHAYRLEPQGLRGAKPQTVYLVPASNEGEVEFDEEDASAESEIAISTKGLL